MQSTVIPAPGARLSNNFGALRLLFAALVVLSHAPEVIDGNRSREILTRVFCTMSFGEFAVDGFFLISGYLITKSFEQSASSGNYILKRVMRIYPGFIAASVLCIFAVGPFVGGQISTLSVMTVVWHFVALHSPELGPVVFPGTHYPALNGAMWTISYEFRCYMLVLVMGATGLLARRRLVLALTVAALTYNALHIHFLSWLPWPPWWRVSSFIGEPDASMRLMGVFGCGTLFYLYRDRIRYGWRPAALAGLGLIALMFSKHLAEAAAATLGAYVLFWFAFNVRAPALARIGAKVDISYGLYLYAWPVEKSLLWITPGMSPWTIFVETLVIAGVLGLASWTLVEKPFMTLKATLIPRGPREIAPS